jgi:3-carboxy-cis,cis-muconate cycloisomerase
LDLLRASVDSASAEWIHFGMTSQDTLDTSLMLVTGDVMRQVESDLAALGATLATLADQRRAVPMVARTLTQQAMPTTLGMRASGWLAGVHDAVRLVRSCTRLPASLGGPVGTTAAYGDHGPAVVDAFAAALGLSTPVSSWHTRRTPLLAIASALTAVGETCGKIATDVLVMSQTEIGEAREATGGSSSAMAHKANPAQSVLVAAAARQLPALGSTIAASGAAEQERPAGAWHAEWQTLRSMLRLSAGAAERTTHLMAGLQLDEDAMRHNLDRLVAVVGRDRAWVASETEHVGVWIDRVLAQHAEVFP